MVETLKERLLEMARRPPMRSRSLMLRLTKDEHERARRLAAKLGVSMSALGRLGLELIEQGLGVDNDCNL